MIIGRFHKFPNLGSKTRWETLYLLGGPYSGGGYLSRGDDPCIRAVDQCVGENTRRPAGHRRYLRCGGAHLGSLVLYDQRLFTSSQVRKLARFLYETSVENINSVSRLVVDLLVLVLRELSEYVYDKLCIAIITGKRHVLSPLVSICNDQYLSNTPRPALDVQTGY